MNETTSPPAAPSGPDLEKAPIEQVLSALKVAPDSGLSAAEAAERLGQYGPNAIITKERSLAAKVFGYFMGPIAYMIEAAALVSAILGHWQDFAVIAALLVFNAVLDLWQDLKASNALAALKKGLAPEATALRDGQWATIEAATLVPGDIVKIRLGVIVPADLRIVAGDYAAIDQSALTGESLPVAKKVGDSAYSGSNSCWCCWSPRSRLPCQPCSPSPWRSGPWRFPNSRRSSRGWRPSRKWPGALLDFLERRPYIDHGVTHPSAKNVN